MQESNDYDPSDDEERDTADDPLLSALDADLSRASKMTDRTLLVVLLGIGLPLLLAFQIHETGTVRMIGVAAAAIIMIGAIPFTMIRTIRLRRHIAVRYGLECSSCGYNPGGMYALATATVPYCRKCRTKVNPVLPQEGQ
jgi:hypothetical protein